MTDDRKPDRCVRHDCRRALAESRAEVAEYAASARMLAVERAEFRIRAERLAGALREVDEYLAEREDVIDGDYGQPEANDEMRLRQVVRTALNLEPTP